MLNRGDSIDMLDWINKESIIQVKRGKQTQCRVTMYFTCNVDKLRNNSRMLGSMLILTWVGIIFVIILHRAKAMCKILTNIMPTHVKISIEPGIRESFRF